MAAIFLAPTCPVAKKQRNKKVVFDTTISATDDKQSRRGKMSVEPRQHKDHECLALPQDHKDEFIAYNTTKYGGKWKGAAGKPGLVGGKPNGEGKSPSPNNKLKFMISSMIVDVTKNK